jgi:two-component system, cell cycle response regulator
MIERNEPSPTRRPPRPDELLPCGIAAAWLAAYATAQYLLRGSADGTMVLANTAYHIPIAAAVLLSGRAAVRTAGVWRRFWALIALACSSWLCGELVWSWYELVMQVEAPFPALPDAFYMGFYVASLAAFLIALNGTGRLRRYRALLDASIIALVLGAIGWNVLVGPQFEAGLSLATLTAATPPLLDLVTLVLIATIGFGGHRNLPGAVTAVMMAYICFALADAAYAYAQLADVGEYPAVLNLGWQAAAVLIAVGAVLGARSEEEPVPVRTDRDRGLPVVLLGTVIALGAAVLDSRDDRLEPWVLGLVCYVVGALVVRQQLTSRDKDRVTRELERALSEQERLAVTDGLTGLYNRRFVEEMLLLETARALRSGERLGLMVIDVDHFKSVNDAHGHEAGDEVLKAIAQRIAASVRRPDVVGRYGGEEFVVILPGADPEVLLELAERCRRAVAAQPFPRPDGPPLPITISLGVAGVPEHALTARELVRTADRALYLAKASGRNRAQVGVDVALPVLDPALGPTRALPVLERVADLVDLIQASCEHSTAVARYSAQVATEMGLSAEFQRRCELAGRLHDIGKIAVPTEVLTKPGQLDDSEWELMRRHPEHGAWMIGLVPGLGEVSGIVRQHHERIDGGGYPEGRTGSAIRLEARILSVCDAWAAMLADRSYQPRSSAARARQVLRDGAGTQWDPEVVRVFLELEAAGRLAPLQPFATGPMEAVQRAATPAPSIGPR